MLSLARAAAVAAIAGGIGAGIRQHGDHSEGRHRARRDHDRADAVVVGIRHVDGEAVGRRGCWRRRASLFRRQKIWRESAGPSSCWQTQRHL